MNAQRKFSGERTRGEDLPPDGGGNKTLRYRPFSRFRQFTFSGRFARVRTGVLCWQV